MADISKSWQSRLRQGQDELAVDFVESISIDARLYKYDIAGSIAHAQMLSEQKLISRDEFRQIKTGLLEISQEIEEGKFCFDKQYEDIHMALEAALIEKIGEAGKKLHTGRSRNDQVALDMRLWMRDCIATIGERIMALQEVLVRQAAKQGEIVMPAYTHLQRAQPILSGSYLLAFVEQLQRDRERYREVLARTNSCPLGSGAVAGSSLPLNRQRVAEILGFTSVTRNSIDSVSDRDFCAEFIFAGALTAMHLSRLAEDWIIYSSVEFGFLSIADAYSTGSSMMPQKRNPDMLELIRGKCGQLYGNLTAMLTMLKGQPLSYNRDMQEDKKQVFDAADTIEACLQMAKAIAGHTKFNAKNIGGDIEAGFLDATALAEYLVRQGVPFREGHQIVGKLVAYCEDKGITLAELSLEKLQEACAKIQADVYDYLSAKNVVASYAVEGSAGKRQLAEQLEYWRQELKQ